MFSDSQIEKPQHSLHPSPNFKKWTEFQKKIPNVFRIAERKIATNLFIYLQLSKCWLHFRYFRMVNNLQILLLFPLTCIARSKTGLLIFMFSWREWPNPTKIELTWNWRQILQIYLYFHDENVSTPATTVVQLANTT